MIELKVGKRYRIKVFKRRPQEWNNEGNMDHWMGQEVTIRTISSYVSIEEDQIKDGRHWTFKAEEFEEITSEKDILIRILRRYLRRSE